MRLPAGNSASQGGGALPLPLPLTLSLGWCGAIGVRGRDIWHLPFGPLPGPGWGGGIGGLRRRLGLGLLGAAHSRCGSKCQLGVRGSVLQKLVLFQAQGSRPCSPVHRGRGRGGGGGGPR